MSRLISDEIWGTLTVWQEARGESHEGKVAVAEVIQRRMARKYSSDGTVIGTVLRAYQFSGWNTADPNRLAAARLDDADPRYLDCLKAWRAVQAGKSVIPNAVLYYAPAGVTKIPAWARPDKRVAQIGGHIFYVA